MLHLDMTGLLQALLFTCTGAVIPLIPTAYLAMFGQDSLMNWYQKRLKRAEVEKLQALSSKVPTKRGARVGKSVGTVRPQKSGTKMSLTQTWGLLLLIVVLMGTDPEAVGAVCVLDYLFLGCAVLSPILLGIGVVLEVLGESSAVPLLAIGMACLLVAIILFVAVGAIALLVASLIPEDERYFNW